MEILCSPNTNDIEEYISTNFKINKKTLHIVPTMILFQRRANFYRQKLKRENVAVPVFHRLSDRKISKYLTEQNVYLFEISRFYEQLVRNNIGSEKVLKRRESSIVLERVLNTQPETNHHVWKSTVSEIHDLFQTLSISGITLKKLKTFSVNESWLQLLNIYKNYLEALSNLNCLDYGLACRKAVFSQNFSEFDEVYIDGAFLPIDSGLHQILTEINNSNVSMKFFIPYDFNNQDNPVFRALRKTYLSYVPIDQWKSINKSVQNHNVVQKLARNIFTFKTIEVDDPSVEIIEFDTMEEEFNAIISRIALLIRKGIIKQHKIAIVTPKPMEMRPYVRELAQFYQLQCEIPERPLIHLPIGKFIFLLYQIQIDERINIFQESNHYIDLDMMSDLIHLHLIKNSEITSDVFEQLKAFFEDCKTFDHWFDKLSYLKKAKEKITEQFKFHPLYFISTKQLDSFRDFISVIDKLSKNIFQEQELSLIEHLKMLLQKLEQEESFIQINEEEIDRISEIVESIQDNNNILIDGREFGTRIQSILKDDHRNDEESYTNDIVKITVTGPNNVEYQEYDYIYLTRFTQNLYPDLATYRWPMNLDLEFKILKNSTLMEFENSRELFHFYLDQSLYHLFIVLNSIEKKLTISYSKKDKGIEQSPSHYLHDIAKTFGVEEDITSKEKLEDKLKNMELIKNATSKPMEYPVTPIISGKLGVIKENTILSIEDIAIYDYCPRRFYYEKQYPNKRAYTDTFHLQNYGAACLYEEAVKLLVLKFPSINKENKKIVLSDLDSILENGKEKIFHIFPLGLRYWEDIKIRTKFHLEKLLNRITENTDHNGAKISLEGQKQSSKINGFTFTGERQLKVSYPTITHYYSISNLKTLLSFSVNILNQEEKMKLDKIKFGYQELLRDFCYGKENTTRKLEEYTVKIKNQEFNKNPGSQCVYCSFKKVCMEKEIQNYAVN